MNSKYIITILVFFIFISCEYNVEELQVIDTENCIDEVSFINTIKPIIDVNCLECHNGNQFPDLRTYQGISTNAERVKNETTARRMPLGDTLTIEEIEAIFCWVESGALNN